MIVFFGDIGVWGPKSRFAIARPIIKRSVIDKASLKNNRKFILYIMLMIGTMITIFFFYFCPT